MAQPVTTTDLFLQEIAASLVEIRDLLQDSQSPAPKQGAIREPARPANTDAPKAPTRPRKKTTK